MKANATIQSDLSHQSISLAMPKTPIIPDKMNPRTKKGLGLSEMIIELLAGSAAGVV